jgi:orotate phosphoribosyltransferase
MNTDQHAMEIAEKLLEIGAVHLNPQTPFTWTSGLKSPIYCDNRMTMSYPGTRRFVANAFAELIRTAYPAVEVIAGTATAGIPHAAWLAELLNLPMIYVRDKAKGHGRHNQIEGVLKEKQKVIVIEDLISTGGSSVRAAKAVQDAGGEVLGVIAIFSYQFDKAEQAFREAGFPFATLSNYTALLQLAKEKGIVKEDQMEALIQWRKDPQAYTQKMSENVT